jgi:hypothetical protein
MTEVYCSGYRILPLVTWHPNTRMSTCTRKTCAIKKPNTYDILSYQPAVQCSFSTFHSVGECTSDIYWPNATKCRIYQLWRKPGISATDFSKTHKTVTPLDTQRSTNCQDGWAEDSDVRRSNMPSRVWYRLLFLGISCIPRKQSLDCGVT